MPPTAVKTRRLSDLFSRGEPLTIDDGEGPPVTVYIQKLTPVDQEKAVRKANAARTVYMADKDKKGSEGYLAALSEALDLEPEELLDYIVTDELARKVQAIEAEYAEETGWMEEDKLQGLFDSWEEGGLKDRYALDPEDPEAKPVFDQMEQYSQGLQKVLDSNREHLKKELSVKTVEQLREMYVDRTVRLQADLHWMLEHRKCEIWLGTRDRNTHAPYFASREEVDDLSQEVLLSLVEVFVRLNVEVDQGKDSPPMEVSSPLFDTSETPEMEPSSSPKE